MPSAFVISQADRRPMYLQLMEQIKRHIAVGNWKPGQAIPSIRQLAADARVSVITVKRAYLELEREGVIATHHGKGSIVAPGADIASRIFEQELAQHLEQAARLGSMLGVSAKDMQTRLRDAAARLSDAEKEKA